MGGKETRLPLLLPGKPREDPCVRKIVFPRCKNQACLEQTSVRRPGVRVRVARWHFSCAPPTARALIPPEMTWPLKIPSGFHRPEITQGWWCGVGFPWPPSPAPCSWFKSVGGSVPGLLWRDTSGAHFSGSSLGPRVPVLRATPNSSPLFCHRTPAPRAAPVNRLPRAKAGVLFNAAPQLPPDL